MHRLRYALLSAVLVTLSAIFGIRLYGQRPEPLPVVEAPAEIAGRSCADSLEKARELTKSRALDRARLAYLWLLSHCESSPVLPEAMLEAGSLFGHLLQQPREARLVYEGLLRRFPANSHADDAIYQLAKLEIDAGDYTAAVAHLTVLAQRYPNGAHEESAKFLAVKAAEMLADERRAQRTVWGQLAALVPNNVLSLLALLAALGPAVIQTVTKVTGGSESGQRRSRWMMPALLIGLTLLNYSINNMENSRKNALLMEKLDRLAASGSASQGGR